MLKFMVVAAAAVSLLPAAELASPNPAGVAWGHFHFNARDLDVAGKFWKTLGAKECKPLGGMSIFEVNNALILIRKGEPTGGSEATVLHHVGFKVKDLEATVAASKAAGYRILQTPETIAKNKKANVMGPDDINIELVADPSMTGVISSHHVHFYTPSIDDTRAWYVKTFGAVAGKRDQFEAADVPGINLTFSVPPTALKGSRGYAIDHIGFEVKDLEAFCKKLEAAGVKFDRPYFKSPKLNLAIAFLTDPWGTYIELTEGLVNLQ